MKNSSDTIANQARDLPTCSEMPQPPALPASCPQSRSIRIYCSRSSAVPTQKQAGGSLSSARWKQLLSFRPVSEDSF